MFWFGSKVRVTLVDGLTGETVAVTKMNPKDLPGSFARATTMHVSGEDWQIVKAVPSSRVEYTKSRRLTLHLSRAHGLQAGAILYSLPSICDAIPGLGETAVDGSEFLLAEDDWRQVELVSSDQAEQVDRELELIRKVHGAGVEGGGWPEIRVRSKPRAPISCDLTLIELMAKLGFKGRPGGLAYKDSPRRIQAGFVLRLKGLTLYGDAPQGRVRSLGVGPRLEWALPLEAMGQIRSLAEDLGLDLVDWCRCARVAADRCDFDRVLAENDG
ncbi:MAG: hypothetical protein P1V35_01560 [Planctomycetota bacterium]|nr:hypothetical protein [Planctomycetota bacterium]